jgi:hypothetical protein
MRPHSPLIPGIELKTNAGHLFPECGAEPLAATRKRFANN